MHTLRQLRHLAGIAAILLLVGCIDMPVQVPELGLNAQPTRAEAAEAIRQALSQGVLRSIDTLGETGGFSADPRVRIPVPDSLDKVADTLERLGQGHHVQAFEQSLNRAAEESVPYATDIFLGALRQMSVEDAIGILRGPDDAATRYFRERTEPALRNAFYPVVAQQTDRVGATQAYKDLIDSTGAFKSYLSPELQDLDAYVTQEALDGLFLYIAREEQRIREQPVARTTDVLRKVFGYYAR